MKRPIGWVAVVALIVTVALPAMASAQAIRGGFDANTLPANDDGSTGLVNIGFQLNFFGVLRDALYVNNNGNVTFDSPLSAYTPFDLSTTNRQIIAPFFADVDTRGSGSNPVTYGAGSVGSRSAFGVNWLGVGYYNARYDKLNYFQLVVIDRGDVGAGDFDFEFNYGSIQWETGDASGGSGGLGGNSARVGWSNGAANTYELTGSAINGAFIDGGPYALNGDRLLFQVRNGEVAPPVTTVPEPASMILLGTGLFGLAALHRRRRREWA